MSHWNGFLGGVNDDEDTTDGAPFSKHGSFEALKAKALKDGVLYEDPDFPACPAAIGEIPSRDFELSAVAWRRPKDIIAEAEFIVGDATRFDIVQGDSLDNCWFVSATACLSVTNQNLLQRCVPFDQSLTKEYAGIFRFNFWHYDKWVEVVVDDRLPTIGGQLIFAHNFEEPNEFWVPLFEKAYAKLKGSYGNLERGETTYALVDFTGGISERINLLEKRHNPGDLFDVMYTVLKRSSMMGCEICSKPPSGQHYVLPNGLICMHAYAITNLIKLTGKSGKNLRLVRIMNPWGEGEWNGPWSDNSKEWDLIPDKIKQQIEFTKKEDGEFWMSFEHFLENFEWLTMCHLNPDEHTATVAKAQGRSLWEVQKHHSEWVRGFSAGGSGRASNNSRFWMNPQFGFTCMSKSGTAVSGVNAPGTGVSGVTGPGVSGVTPVGPGVLQLLQMGLLMWVE